MKFEDINRKFTEKVAEYIAEGYIINTESMRGSQGEIGKVDLVKGTELIRIWTNSESNWSDPDGFYDNKVVLRVSRWQYDYDPRRDVTVWMSEMIHEEEIIFYEIGRFRNSKWYLDNLEEALTCIKKRNERMYHRDYTSSTLLDITSDSSKEIATKYLKNHKDYKRVSREKIHVQKRVYEDSSTPEYIVKYNGSQIYKLK